MMDVSKIKRILPESELGEIRPCTTAGKVQFHLLVAGRKDPTKKVLDLKKLESLMKTDKKFSGIKRSDELSVVKAVFKGAEMSILGSGRVVVRKADDEKHAQELLEALAPMLKESTL